MALLLSSNVTGTLNVTANIANVGNLLVTQNTFTGNIKVTTLANVATLNISTSANAATINCLGILAANASPLINTATRAVTGLVGFKKTATACSAATLTVDNNLLLTFNETGWYSFEIYLPIASTTANGFAGFQFDLGSNTAHTANINYQVSGFTNAAVATAAAITLNTTATSTSNIAVSGGQPSWYLAKGVLTITTVGNLGIRWGQAVTNATNTTNLLQGAYFRANKIG